MGFEPLTPKWAVDFWLAVILLPATTFTVCLRAYVRLFMVRSFGADDYCLIVMQILCIASTTPQIIFAGTTVKTLKDLETHIDLFLVCGSLYIVAILMLKISLALFYLRFLIERWQRLTVYISMIAFAIVTIPTFFAILFYCGRPDRFLPNYFQGKCLSWSIVGGLNYAYGVFDVFTNWLLAFVTVSVIRNSSMPRKAKISAGCLVGMGSIGGLVSIARLAFIEEINLVNNYKINGSWQTNLTEAFPASTVTIASLFECSLGVFAACGAALRPLFRSLKTESRDNSEVNEPRSIKFVQVQGKKLRRGKVGLSTLEDQMLGRAPHLASLQDMDKSLKTENGGSIHMSTTIKSPIPNQEDDLEEGLERMDTDSGGHAKDLAHRLEGPVCARSNWRISMSFLGRRPSAATMRKD